MKSDRVPYELIQAAQHLEGNAPDMSGDTKEWLELFAKSGRQAQALLDGPIVEGSVEVQASVKIVDDGRVLLFLSMPIPDVVKNNMRVALRRMWIDDHEQNPEAEKWAQEELEVLEDEIALPITIRLKVSDTGHLDKR